MLLGLHPPFYASGDPLHESSVRDRPEEGSGGILHPHLQIRLLSHESRSRLPA